VKISEDKKKETYQENLNHINATGSNAHNAEFPFNSLFSVAKTFALQAIHFSRITVQK